MAEQKTKIAFIADHQFAFEPLGIMLLAGILKKNGYSVKLFEQNGRMISGLKAYRPAILCYSLVTGFEQSYIALNKRLKTLFPEAVAVFGGPYPTYNQDFFTPFSDVDAICIGEGDYALPDLVSKVEAGHDYSAVENFYVKKGGSIVKNKLRDLVDDLDALPFPDRAVMYEANRNLLENPVKRFYVSRGCAFDCSYCFNHSYKILYADKGRLYRHRSAENVVREIETVKGNYPLESLKFVDDMLSPAFLRTFLPLYEKRVRLPFSCHMRPDVLARTPGLAEMLRSAGCVYIAIGIESASDSMRREILNRHIEREDIKAACDALKKNKIKVMTLNMVGNPGETFDEALATLKLNMELGVDHAACTLLQPYKGTKIYDLAAGRGYIDDKKNQGGFYYDGSPIKFRTPREKMQIMNLRIFFNLITRNKRLYRFLVPVIKTMPHLRIGELFNRLYEFYSVSKLYPVNFTLAVRLRSLMNWTAFFKKV
ncbi:MAG: radical SAM protein [Candidatus Omnitrophica bacterium]|nr:radical SAM protein [Candidatus Omnitrophota bacterium]